MRNQTIVMGALLALGWSSAESSLTAADPVISKDEEAIRKVIGAGLAAANNHDAKAVASIFHKDATFTIPIGDVLRGPVAIEKHYALLFQDFDRRRGVPSLKKQVVKHEKETIRFLRPDVAAVEVRYTFSGVVGPDGKDWGTKKGLLRYVLTREDGIWAVADKHVMDLPDIPGRPGNGTKN